MTPNICSYCGITTAKKRLVMCPSLQAVLGPLIAIALKISNIHERTGRRGPNVITWAITKNTFHLTAHTEKKNAFKVLFHLLNCHF